MQLDLISYHMVVKEHVEESLPHNSSACRISVLVYLSLSLCPPLPTRVLCLIPKP